MITSLGLRNFKNFADAKLNMGPFTVIVGANASGKSNLRDAFRFLHGVGRGYTLADIFGGKHGAGGQVEWQPLRGAPNEIVRFDQPSFDLNVTMELNEREVSYRIAVGPDSEKSGLFTVKHESLLVGYYEPEYTSHPASGADPMTGRVQLALRERNGRIVSSYAASDGTLRLLAMLAALLGPNPAGLYVFEEIDNGIHPARQRLLLDLIEGQTAEGRIQVVTTTHSPDLLELVGDRTFEHTSVVCRLPDTDDAVVRPLADLPNAGALRQSQGLGRLHRSNWMEDAILFTSSDTAKPDSVGSSAV